MMRALFAAALVLNLLHAGPADAAALDATDDAGRRLTLTQPARRVIALSPHLTELAYAVGAGEQVVGVSRFSDYPKGALTKPVVGDAFALNFEAIAQLKPDLVLVWGSGFPDRARQQLRTLGVPVFENEIRTVAGIAQTLRTLGRLTGHAEQGAARAAELEAQWAALQARYAGRKPVRVFYQLWHQPLMTLNREHLISQAVSACGGVNVFADLPTLTATVGWEAAVQRNPQVIALAGKPGQRPDLGLWPDFPQVEAVRRQHVAVLDGDLVGRMGPRFVDGARQLCEALDAAR